MLADEALARSLQQQLDRQAAVEFLGSGAARPSSGASSLLGPPPGEVHSDFRVVEPPLYVPRSIGAERSVAAAVPAASTNSGVDVSRLERARPQPLAAISGLSVASSGGASAGAAAQLPSPGRGLTPASPLSPLSVEFMEAGLANGAVSVSASTIARIRNEIAAFRRSANRLAFVLPFDVRSPLLARFFVLGAEQTPFELGLFEFRVTFSPRYPWDPPAVQYVPSQGQAIGFVPHPIVRPNGDVALAILGNCGPSSWSPVMSLESIIHSVQAVLSARPYEDFGDADLERLCSEPSDRQLYLSIIRHETLRLAVAASLERSLQSPVAPELEPVFREQWSAFRSSFARLESELRELARVQDGCAFEDPLRINHGQFDFSNLWGRLGSLHQSAGAPDANKT